MNTRAYLCWDLSPGVDHVDVKAREDEGVIPVELGADRRVLCTLPLDGVKRDEYPVQNM